MHLFWTVKLGSKRSPKSLWLCGRECVNQSAILWICQELLEHINSFRSLEYGWKYDFSINPDFSSAGAGSPRSCLVCHLFLQVKFHWNMTMLICLDDVNGCFCATMAVELCELWQRPYSLQSQKFTLWLFTESLLSLLQCTTKCNSRSLKQLMHLRMILACTLRITCGVFH